MCGSAAKETSSSCPCLENIIIHLTICLSFASSDTGNIWKKDEQCGNRLADIWVEFTAVSLVLYIPTPSPRWAAEPPGCRGTQPITSVSCHPHPARWGPSASPPSAGPGSRPGPPCGTCHSWCTVSPPCSTPFPVDNTSTFTASTSSLIVVQRLKCRAVPPCPPHSWSAEELRGLSASVVSGETGNSAPCGREAPTQPRGHDR